MQDADHLGFLRMTSLLVTALAVARRRGRPIRRPSYKKLARFEHSDHRFAALLEETTTLMLPLRI